MSADLDTLGGESYAPNAQVLPGERLGAGAVTGGSGNAGLSAAGCAEALARSDQLYSSLRGWICSEQADRLTHAELEERLAADGRELLRQLYQDRLDLRAVREGRVEQVVDSDGVRHANVERSHGRPLATVVGEVRVSRMAYRARGAENLYPADRVLNLPQEKHSHGLRRLVAIESPRGSFEDASDAIWRQTGQRVANRQVQELARAAAADFKQFYAERAREIPEEGDALVLSCDGKGVVMRPEALRAATKKQAENSQTKLETRLSRGEKRGRKRMAEVAAVYEVTPQARTPADVLPATAQERALASAGPRAKNKWVCASVTDNAAEVITRMFAEAGRRDPHHKRSLVALVDGNNHQIDRIKKEAKERSAPVTILVDYVHVLEYLWGAAWCFFNEGDRAAERWVHEKGRAILKGQSGTVAAAIRRKATCLGLDADNRANADRCADYLLNKRAYLDYPTALKNGWPIATGVIEGACRHLVKDRMDITGARWGLAGAEAVLKLRALKSNGDFADYWRFHLAQERRRVHESRYASSTASPPA